MAGAAAAAADGAVWSARGGITGHECGAAAGHRGRVHRDAPALGARARAQGALALLLQLDLQNMMD